MKIVRTPVVLVALGVCMVLGCVLAGAAGAKPSEHPFGIVPGSFHFTPSSLQAGAHADWVTSFAFEPEGEGGATYNDARNISVELPAGFDASNTAVPTCSQAQLLAINKVGPDGEVPECPLSSQVGLITLEIFKEGTSPEQLTVPLYNMEVTTFGTTAELGFKTVIFTELLQIGVRAQDLGLTSSTTNLPKAGETHKVAVTVWGVPAAKEHDALRGAVCGDRGESPPVCHNEYGAPQPANTAVRPFLSNPTSCGVSEARMEADSWEEPFNWSKASDTVGPIVECERVPFEPSIEAQPSTRSAESPTGLAVSLLVPQAWENPLTISTSNLKDATVTLPEGMTANPSLAAGLGACTPGQYAAETSSSLPGEGCPSESKIGSIEIETPLLNEKVDGAVYIAKPYENEPSFGDPEHPGGSLLALYVVAKDPERGILIKVAGKITPNPVTGQLVTTFSNNPQQPFNRFTLKFRPGATAPLASPPTCGSYSVQAALSPWSAPEEPRFVSSQPFAITQGVHEGSCPTSGIPPFKPQVISGTQNNAGGAYSPFYLRILREDGEQELTRFSTTLPPGLTGNLSGIPFCPDASIEAAKGVSGAEEEANPSCPVASEIGHTIVSAGVGSVLAQTPGKVYLAGPYHGAPLSIVSITSAKVGPFDLGTVVIRFALNINPNTAQVEVSANGSDPIPHIIKGIVVHVREIRVYMDRPNFIINPTNCSPLSITDTIDGAGADFTNPADQVPVSVGTPFEAADCSSLQFKPAFKVTTNGKTSKANGASLSVKLSYPNAPQGTQANITRVKVDLPKQLPSRLTTLQKACTAAQFETNPAGCPAASFIGHAKAITPILPVPLEGPAIFVSHGGEAFPSLEVVLQGYGVTIDLVGSTFISKAGITSSTFKTVPDQPVTSFELTLPQGPYSALAANGNLCASKLAMPTEFVAQNGAAIHQSTPVTVTGCAKKKPLTRAQKLAAALKVCHKQPKRKRASCERQARRKYGPPARKAKKARGLMWVVSPSRSSALT
jgi:hypothetical protein